MNREYDLFKDGIKCELSNILRGMWSRLEVAQRLNLENRGLNQSQAEEMIQSVDRGLHYIQWLFEDLNDLVVTQKPDFRKNLMLMDISEQVQFLHGAIAQQMEDRGWQGRILLDGENTFYAEVEPGIFCTVCANAVASLYYYGSEKDDAVISVTDRRTVEMYISGVHLPEMVMRKVENAQLTDYADYEGVGVFGMIFGAMFCKAMGWRLTFREEDAQTVIVLEASELNLSLGPRERLASDAVLHLQQMRQVILRVGRSFRGMFGE